MNRIIENKKTLVPVVAIAGVLVLAIALFARIIYIQSGLCALVRRIEDNITKLNNILRE